MKKRPVFRIKGLRRRWLLNTVGVVTALGLVCVLAVTALFAAYYYSSMESDMRYRARTTTEFFADYLNQSYCHYKQVIVVYSKGDAVAEENARLAITAAHDKLLAGADIDDVIAEYGDKNHQSEIYFDAYGNIVGSATGSSVNAIVINAIKALEKDGISDIMSGDEGDRLAYFAVYQRLGFDQKYICSDDGIAATMYNYSYVGSDYYSPQYSRYMLLLESYTQNTALEPYNVKAYNRIHIKNID